MNYVDYINADIQLKLRNPKKFTDSEIARLKHAKKIKREQMLFIDVELLSNKD